MTLTGLGPSSDRTELFRRIRSHGSLRRAYFIVATPGRLNRSFAVPMTAGPSKPKKPAVFADRERSSRTVDNRPTI